MAGGVNSTLETKREKEREKYVDNSHGMFTVDISEINRTNAYIVVPTLIHIFEAYKQIYCHEKWQKCNTVTILINKALK